MICRSLSVASHGRHASRSLRGGCPVLPSSGSSAYTYLLLLVSDTAAAIYEDDEDELVHSQIMCRDDSGVVPTQIYVVPTDTDSSEYEDRQTTD